LRILLLRQLLLCHRRHRLAGIGIDHVVGRLLAGAGTDRERGHYGEQQSDVPHQLSPGRVTEIKPD
jgi:hypothetical protein